MLLRTILRGLIMNREQLIEALVAIGFCRDVVCAMNDWSLAQLYSCHTPPTPVKLAGTITLLIP